MATKYRNYFRGFPFLTGYQYGNYRSKSGERPQPLRLVFSGNDSAYGRTLPLVYGKCRIADPILLIAKPEGDFLTTLWAVADGPLATNATSDAQTTPSNAYIKTSGVENIFVNGVSRHDPRPGYGIEVSNGDQDKAEPGAAFFPAGAGQINDFITNNLGFWGTARVTFRINTKSNPSVDVSGQSITGSMEIAYGRVHRVYTTDASTYVRRATANGSTAGANPAYVQMDVMTSKRSGGGLDYSRLNIQSFYDVATYCNVSVTNTFDGSSVPRWTFNGILDQRKSFPEWMHLLSISMYALPPFIDATGKLKIKALKSESTSGVPLFSSKVASATARNIVWDGHHSSLVKSRRPISEIPNEIRVNFVENVTYSKLSIVISDRDSQTAFGTNLGDQSRRVMMKSIDLPGVTTMDEAARIGTLILRAGEFGQGGLANNLKVRFKAFYRDCEDLEIGDVIEAEDDLLDASLGEQFFRVTHISTDVMSTTDGGIVLGRTIEAVLHSNTIYDDTALTVTKFDRIAPPDPSDKQPPPVTGFSITESGVTDANGKSTTQLVINYTEPSPKSNFRSVALFRSNDDGSSNPVGDWRFVGEVFVTGETIQYEVTGKYEHFCAVSRALSAHVGDIEALDSAGSYVYPRMRILVDGKADATLPAPTNLNAYGRQEYVWLTWDKYTGNNAQLCKGWNVYRNTTNNSATSTFLHRVDGNSYTDDSDTVRTNPSTTYYYWVRGVSILENVVINGTTWDEASGLCLSAYSTSANDNPGTDTAVPDAPTLSAVRSLPLQIIIGITAGATNQDSVESYEIQITTDSGFSSFPTGNSLNKIIAHKLPDVVTFDFDKPGIYYARCRAINVFGNSSYSGTLTYNTDVSLNAVDTDVPDAPTSVTLVTSSAGNPIAGNGYQVQFGYPTNNVSSVWGWSVFVYTTSTLPSPTTAYDSSSSGGTLTLVPGSNRFTVAGHTFTANQWTSPDEHDLIVFGNLRSGSPQWSLETMIYCVKIAANGTNYFDIDFPANRQIYNLSSLKFYIVKRGISAHVWEKCVAYELDHVDRDELRSIRRFDFNLNTTGLRAFAVLHSVVFGAGKLSTASSSASMTGIIAAEIATDAVTTAKIIADAVTNIKIATDAITTTKIADNQISTPKLIALSVTTLKLDALAVTTAKIDAGAVTAVKISVATLSAISADVGTITAGTITGATVRTGSGSSRVEINSSDGLKVLQAGTVIFSADLSGLVKAFSIDSITNGLTIYGSSTNGLSLANYNGGSAGVIITAAGNVQATVAASQYFHVDVFSTTRAKVDDGDSSTQTALLVRQDGSLRRVKTTFVAQDTWGVGSPATNINVLYVN